MDTSLSDKRVLITGASGTVGRELVKQLFEVYEVGELIAVDNNESELYFLEREYADYNQAKFFLGDIRDKEKLCNLMYGMDIVFHTAAFKHVSACERSPFEAVRTNVIGVQNIISAAFESNVKKVIFTSSDKAVNPSSVMGTSKLMGERLITAANCNSRSNSVVFASTRFGNVLGSRGSVIPIFREQIRRGGPVTVTDEGMTRFIMSIKEAAQLVIKSSFYARGGEVFITKMPVIRIRDLAEVMIQELAIEYGYGPKEIPIEIIGIRSGEKMYEELMNGEETRRAIELERYFVVKPAFTGLYKKIEYVYPDIISETVTNPYNSSNQRLLSKKYISEFLNQNSLLFKESDEKIALAKRYWFSRKDSPILSKVQALNLLKENELYHEGFTEDEQLNEGSPSDRSLDTLVST